MEHSLVAMALFFLGVIVGSFLNVFVYRLHTNRTLGGRSHCMSCGHTLSWFELIPVLSYLLQRGRCRACSALVTSRYAVVEVLTGVLFGTIGYLISDWVEVGLLLSAASILMVILVYDILHTIIPDEMVLALSVPLCGLALYKVWGAPEPVWSVLYIFLGALAASGFFAALWVVSRGRWVGLGDAKLAFPLALAVGPLGVFSLIVLAFWIGAVVSVALLLLQRLFAFESVRGKLRLVFLSSPLTIKSEVPFAPFLILSFLFVYLFSADVFGLIGRLIPSF